MVEKAKLAPVVQKYIENENQAENAALVGQLFWQLLEEFNTEEASKQGEKKKETAYHIPDLAVSLSLLEEYYFPLMSFTEVELHIDVALASVIEYIKRETAEETYPLDFKGRLEALDFYIEVLKTLPEPKTQVGIKWKFIEELCHLSDQIGPPNQIPIAAEGISCK